MTEKLAKTEEELAECKQNLAEKINSIETMENQLNDTCKENDDELKDGMINKLKDEITGLKELNDQIGKELGGTIGANVALKLDLSEKEQELEKAQNKLKQVSRTIRPMAIPANLANYATTSPSYQVYIPPQGNQVQVMSRTNNTGLISTQQYITLYQEKEHLRAQLNTELV